MTTKRIEQLQEDHAAQAINSLVMTCRARFIRSADLVGIRGPAIDHLQRLGLQESINVVPLMNAWLYLCKRYRAERYDPQQNLFRNSETELEELWGKFVYHELIPQLLREDELVRNILRAVRGLPCTDPDKAAEAVYQYFLEMTLPAMSPPWAPEEII